MPALKSVRAGLGNLCHTQGTTIACWNTNGNKRSRRRPDALEHARKSQVSAQMYLACTGACTSLRLRLPAVPGRIPEVAASLVDGHRDVPSDGHEVDATIIT